eukprot:jgi/Psemu1/51284/gm1.51284_g
MIDFSHNAFARSKHNPVILHRVDDNWKVFRETIAKDEEFVYYRKFWSRRLQELYSSYHSKTASANMVEIQNDHSLTELENRQQDLANTCHEIYSQADVNRLKAADVNRLKASQNDNNQPQQTGSQSPQLEWKQYKYYCHTCGVNLSHDGRGCYRGKGTTRANHQGDATYDDKMGGCTKNADKWMKWYGPNYNGTAQYLTRPPPEGVGGTTLYPTWSLELTKQMSGLTYTPSPIGPREYFRQLTKYQHQINLWLYSPGRRQKKKAM